MAGSCKFEVDNLMVRWFKLSIAFDIKHNVSTPCQVIFRRLLEEVDYFELRKLIFL